MMPPNAWGLYDMEGNLMQLTNDVWSPYSANSQINPLATTSSGWGPGNVVRGGDFGNSTVINAMKLCAAFRSFCGPWQPLNYLGFRLVRGAH